MVESEASGFVRAGGFLGYSAVIDDLQMQIAVHIERVLRGIPVREIPFEQPTKYRLEINRKTAAALGLAIPHELLLRADEVYE